MRYGWIRSGIEGVGEEGADADGVVVEDDDDDEEEDDDDGEDWILVATSGTVESIDDRAVNEIEFKSVWSISIYVMLLMSIHSSICCSSPILISISTLTSS